MRGPTIMLRFGTGTEDRQRQSGILLRQSKVSDGIASLTWTVCCLSSGESLNLQAERKLNSAMIRSPSPRAADSGARLGQGPRLLARAIGFRVVCRSESGLVRRDRIARSWADFRPGQQDREEMDGEPHTPGAGDREPDCW
jgi:hypothetical protein